MLLISSPAIFLNLASSRLFKGLARDPKDIRARSFIRELRCLFSAPVNRNFTVWFILFFGCFDFVAV